MREDYQLGISKEFPCNYLLDKNERLLIATDQRFQTSENYSWLMAQGFRRSGDQIYRPHCDHCKACQSLRVMVNHFSLSKSQKRLSKKNHHFTVNVSKQKRENYYSLYEKYINTLHADGSMYPATLEQYTNFLTCHLTEQIYVEIWDDEKLISVAVTDLLSNALSAVYTFYDSDYRKEGLGVYSILSQITIAKQFKKEFLYLGYQIDDCKKMNYKNKYFPYQILQDNTWHIVNK